MYLEHECLVVVLYLSMGEFYLCCILFLLDSLCTFPKQFQMVQEYTYDFFNLNKANQNVFLLILFSSKTDE